MHFIHPIIAIVLAGFIFTHSAMAADAALPTPAQEVKLDSITATPATEGITDDKCPMHKGKKHCKENHAEPCPHHDKGHHDKLHEKCEHEHQN